MVFNFSFAQSPEWVNFTVGNYIQALAFEGDYIWVGTEGGGLVKLNMVTGEKVHYNKANSGLPSNWVLAIAIDGQGNKWIGTDWGGLVKFDGLNWTVYNTSNSSLPSDTIFAIAIDSKGSRWIGTSRGLAKFDRVNWTVYNTSNSGLPSNYVYAIAMDG